MAGMEAEITEMKVSEVSGPRGEISFSTSSPSSTAVR